MGCKRPWTFTLEIETHAQSGSVGVESNFQVSANPQAVAQSHQGIYTITGTALARSRTERHTRYILRSLRKLGSWVTWCNNGGERTRPKTLLVDPATKLGLGLGINPVAQSFNIEACN